MKLLISIVGPTAAGKTAYSIHLAKALGAPVVSADSVQIYKGLDIGSGKVTKEEAEGVPHYLIDILEPCEDFSAGAYERETDRLLPELFEKHDVVLLVGGSGFYVQAVWEGFDEMPLISEEVRNEVARDWKENGLEALVDELKRVDPVTWEVIDRKNPVRVLRAIEVFRASGEPISEFRKGKEKKKNDFREIRIGLRMEREELYERIERRVDLMMEAGWLDETKRLWEMHGRECKGLLSLGYRELVGHLEEEYSLEEAVELVKRNTRRYAKRQLTWFRRFEDVQWFRYDDYEGMDSACGLGPHSDRKSL